MNKKQTIQTIVILATAFVAGWAIYSWITTSDNQKAPVSYTSTDKQADTATFNTTNGPGFRRMINILKLSSEQTRKFSEIEGQYRRQIANYTQQLDGIDLSILDELKSETPNENKLDSLAIEAGSIQYQLKTATSHHFLTIKNLCTPQQKERFNKVIADINKFRRGQGNGPGQGYGRRGQGRGRNHRQ
jgi:Spy/CpxP family protein refolding chaperone